MSNQELNIEYEFLPSKDNTLRLQNAYRLIFEKIEAEEKEIGERND